MEVRLGSLRERRCLGGGASVPAAPGRGPLRLCLRLRRLLMVVSVCCRLLRVLVSEAPPLLPVLVGPRLESCPEQRLLRGGSRLRALQRAIHDAGFGGGGSSSCSAGSRRGLRRSGGEAVSPRKRAAVTLLLLLLLLLYLQLVLLPM